MSTRKAFALPIDKKTLDAMHRWADDDLRDAAEGRCEKKQPK